MKILRWQSFRKYLFEHTNLTPADYIRRLRLSRSALRLRDEKCRILDVALDMGFGSVDGYQRAFYREFGCNPRVTRQGPGPLLLFIPYGVKYRNLRKEPEEMENIKSVFVQMTERPSIKVILPHAGHIQICAGRGGGGGLSGTGAGGLCVY